MEKKIHELNLSAQNRFTLTLASVSSILQSESFLKMNTQKWFEMNIFYYPIPPRYKVMHLFPSSYQNLVEVGKSRKGAIVLDIGSCSENRHNNPNEFETLTS